MNRPLRKSEGLTLAAKTVFAASVAVTVQDIAGAAQASRLFAGEHLATLAMVPQRRHEFSAGRGVAHDAMRALNLTPQPVLMARDRAPIWPSGLVGSISHTADICIAAVAHARDIRSLGVDIASARALDDDLMHIICRADELAALSHLPSVKQRQHAKLIFSAKEAAYKCQYPLSGEVLDFMAMRIEFAGKGPDFRAIFMRNVGGFTSGSFLEGAYHQNATTLLTGVTISTA